MTVPPIEPLMVPVCEALNALPGVHTFSSCEGHENPEGCQAPDGEFFVCFWVDYKAKSWKSLERIADAVEEAREADFDVVLIPWSDGGLNFQLEGLHPAADVLVDILNEVEAKV